MVAVSVVIALLVVPPAIARLWLFTTDEARFETILDLLRGPRGIVWVIAVSIIQVVAGLAVSQWIARREAARITRPMTELTAQAERLGAGESRAHADDQRHVSLDSVLAALQREWQPAFASARRSVRVHGERGLYVQATRSAVSQIISTLLENSLQHGRGTVDVHARRSGPSVVLEMSDQGVGVPLDIAAHIFERSVSSRGSGLGLALARDLAAANGGRLELVSAQPAVFALFLSEAPAP